MHKFLTISQALFLSIYKHSQPYEVSFRIGSSSWWDMQERELKLPKVTLQALNSNPGGLTPMASCCTWCCVVLAPWCPAPGPVLGLLGKMWHMVPPLIEARVFLQRWYILNAQRATVFLHIYEVQGIMWSMCYRSFHIIFYKKGGNLPQMLERWEE